MSGQHRRLLMWHALASARMMLAGTTVHAASDKPRIAGADHHHHSTLRS
jgi:hypothetical protein